MIYRIEIGLKDGVPDARGRGVIHRAAGALKMAIAECRTRDVYKVVADIDDATASVIQKTFADPVVAESAMGRLPAPATFDWMLEVGFKPGVTDNVGRTARGALKGRQKNAMRTRTRSHFRRAWARKNSSRP